MKILSFILILIFSCSPALAHTCTTFKNLSDKEHSEKLKEVDIIFEGEVVSRTNVGGQSYLLTYKVSRVWKGEVKPEITVKFDNPCGQISEAESEPLGASIKESKEAKTLIYGYTVKAEPYSNVNCCNLNLFDENRMKREYGEGVAVKQPIQKEPEKNSESFFAWIWKKLFSFFS